VAPAVKVDDLKVKDVDQADQKGIAPKDKDVDRAGLRGIDQKVGDVGQADLRVKDADQGDHSLLACQASNVGLASCIVRRLFETPLFASHSEARSSVYTQLVVLP